MNQNKGLAFERNKVKAKFQSVRKRFEAYKYSIIISNQVNIVMYYISTIKL